MNPQGSVISRVIVSFYGNNQTGKDPELLDTDPLSLLPVT